MQALLDELEHLVRNAIRIPVSGKLLVDESALQRLLDELRAAAPDELHMGQRIAGERDRILAEARAQARRIIEEAQAQVHARVEEQGMVQAARQRARELQQEGEKAAAALRSEADQYVLQQLNAFEARLVRLLREVQAGQRSLSPDGSERTERGPRS